MSDFSDGFIMIKMHILAADFPMNDSNFKADEGLKFKISCGRKDKRTKSLSVTKCELRFSSLIEKSYRAS